MKKASRLVAGLAVFGLVFAACGGDEAGVTGTDSGDELTVTEASALFSELFVIGFGGLSTAPAPLAAAAAEPIPTITTDCPEGGSVTVSGDISGGETSVSFDLSEVINGCKILVNGVTFTLNDEIAITGDINVGGLTISGFEGFSVSYQTLSGSMDMQGGFSYTTDDDRAGSCAVDVSIGLSNFSTSGTVCGHSITALAG